MEFDTPSNDLLIAPNRNRLLMSDQLRGRVPALEMPELESAADDIADSSIDIDSSALTVATLVIERTANNESCHLIGSLIAIEFTRLADAAATDSAVLVSMRLPFDEAWTAVEDSTGAISKLTRYYGDIQLHRSESDPILRVNGPMRIISAKITDVTSAGTCTLTLNLRTHLQVRT